MVPDLLHRKTTHFVLWRPRVTDPPPQLVIGQFQSGNPPTLAEERRIALRPSPGTPDLWEIAAGDCQLVDGTVYHYWFEVQDSNPYKSSHPRILCSDPAALTVDWRLKAPSAGPGFGEADRDPAGVVRFASGRIEACDPGGEVPDWTGDPRLDALPPNNRLVIYELPTSWSNTADQGGLEIAAGTFRDVLALIEEQTVSPAFPDVAALAAGRAHLRVLGINGLELLPPADSFVDREWGYATSNYFAADFDLGLPVGHASPTATTDLAGLVKACHVQGMRFFSDMVMAFATQYSYQNINFLDFHVQANAGDPEEFNNGKRRDGFGGDLFKYNFQVTGYEPLAGNVSPYVPARQLLRTHLFRWMQDFRIDGIRMDSVENIANWDFVREFANHAREIWRGRASAQGISPADADARFLVVGEELAVPIALLEQKRLDSLWNEHFKRMVRYAITGENDEKEPSFEWTVRKLIDCRLLGFGDGAQAINYVTSHDVGGFRNERLYNFLNNNGVVETEPRIKLAFACLLTAVGVPMIFAGEEFADQHDLPIDSSKQVDPVNFSRLDEEWRQRVFQYCSRLVRLRIGSDALAVNDTRFLHVDLNDGKRVLVWQRGQDGHDAPVVVLANFSDYGTPNASSPQAEYVVPNWPATPPGKRWREITQERDVPPEWIGREPIFPWEAKVYTLV
jgi:pullulanase